LHCKRNIRTFEGHVLQLLSRPCYPDHAIVFLLFISVFERFLNLHGEVILGSLAKHWLLRILLLAVHTGAFHCSLVRAHISIMAILVAMKTHNSIIGSCDLIGLQNYVEFALIDFVFLTVCALVTFLAAVITYWDLLVLSLGIELVSNLVLLHPILTVREVR
jgi:hypothetical protein